mmetsp:Transcript_20855/g.21235  ORF Transcript_20855/g.21235 Transcript_20855/m.21235 type:complete len:84 (+) Transcript_20855:269-520(+)
MLWEWKPPTVNNNNSNKSMMLRVCVVNMDNNHHHHRLKAGITEYGGGTLGQLFVLKFKIIQYTHTIKLANKKKEKKDNTHRVQ